MMTRRTALPNLLLINGAFNALGAAVLLCASGWLSTWLHLGHDVTFLWWLLAGASLSLALLSFGAARLRNPDSMRLAVWVFITFHGTSALVSAWAVIHGLTPWVWINTAVHVIFTGLFVKFRDPSLG